LQDAVNGWVGSLFTRDNVDRTVRDLVAANGGSSQRRDHGQSQARLLDAEAKMRRFQSAIEAGIDPLALVEAINQAQAERAAARAQLDNTDAPGAVAEAEVYAMVDALGDVGAALTSGNPEKLAQLYRDLRLDLRYDNEKEAVYATASPRVNNERVRGGT
jgi:hypothetical protein